MKTQILRRVHQSSVKGAPDRPQFVMAGVLLLLAFFTVGGARDDLLSLLIWRPVSALFLAIAIAMYGREAWQRGKPLLLLCLAIAALVIAHLIPLPPAIWTSLPGREIIADVYRSAAMDLPWQPISIAQARTWNALFSLAGPAAILIIALVLDERRHRQLLLLFLSLGFLSGIIGMIQAIGSSSDLLQFYRITNRGISVGLFANRNHQAAYLASLYPLLAASLSLFKGRPDRLFFQRSVTLAAAALLVPLILMTGSRAGIVLMVAGMIFAWWVYRTPVSKGRIVGIRSEHRSRLVGVAIAFCLLIVVAVVATSTPALQRLMDTDPASELRFRALPFVVEAMWRFFPVGSGIGTFVETYQIVEPDVLISAEYFNHAHNDFVEVLMTGGIPALVLLLWAIGLGVAGFIALWRNRGIGAGEYGFSAQVMGRAGFAVLAMLALASASDYPLRVPSLALYVAVASAWCLNAYRFSRK